MGIMGRNSPRKEYPFPYLGTAATLATLMLASAPTIVLGASNDSTTAQQRQSIESPASQAGYYFESTPPPPPPPPARAPAAQTRNYFGTMSPPPPEAYTPFFGQTLGGCALELPGGRGSGSDSGLSETYMQNQQGRDWLFAPMLTVREVYSDNVTLAPSGDEKSDFITEVIPGFTVCDSGPRWRGQLHYELQGLYYAKHQSLNHIYNNAQGSGTAELLRNHLYFDASTFYGQQTIDPTQTFSTNNTLATGNRTNTWTLNLSPYWRQSLGALGLSTVRYRFGSVMYDTSRVPDSHSNTFSFDLINPPTNTTWSWNAYVRSEQVDREGDFRTTYFDTASLDLGYQLMPRIRLLAEGGVEDDYRPDGTTDRFGSEFWNAGFLWTGDRTSLEARYGHRFFGTSYFARLQHQAARLTTSLTYTEEPQVVSRLAIDNPNAILLPGQPPGLIFEPSDESLTPLTNNEVFVRKRLEGAAAYQTGRSTISLNTFNERREFQVSDNDERVRGLTLYWRWQWLPRTALIPRWTWEKIDFQSDQTDYLSQQQISVAHLISPTSQAALTLRHQWRNSTRAESQYTENAVIIEYTKIF